MKKDDILDAMSGIKDEYVNEAVPGAARRKSSVWAKAGVIAACLCLFAAVGFLIPYGMNKPAVKPPVDTDTVGSGVETTVPATNETTGMVEDSTDTEDVQNTPSIGGTALCKVHHDMYHSIYGGLSDYVGSEKYSEWVKTLKVDETKINSDTECPIEGNIKLFIDTFNISKTEFAENCNLIQCPEYDLNVLYSKTAEEIDLYYRDIGQFKNVSLSSAHYQYLKDEIAEKYTDELKEKDIGVGELNMMSIPELVFELNIERDELEALMGDASKTCAELFGANYTYDYNLDMLYGNAPLGDLSENAINEMFCRVGRYADNDFDFIENPDDTDVEENTPAIGGGDYSCNIHHTYYHSIPSGITELVGGREAMREKFANYNTDNMSCPKVSLKQIIDVCGITRDEFAETVRLVTNPVYDIDILFNSTLQEADEFYSNIEWLLSLDSLANCYRNLYSEIEAKYPDGVKEIDGGIRLLSIPELVKLLDIKREDLEEMIKKSSDNGAKTTYNYNLDMLYGLNGEIIFEKPDDVSSYELDEMFCRAGRHVE